jgi:hypothetical protein
MSPFRLQANQATDILFLSPPKLSRAYADGCSLSRRVLINSLTMAEVHFSAMRIPRRSAVSVVLFLGIFQEPTRKMVYQG